MVSSMTKDSILFVLFSACVAMLINTVFSAPATCDNGEATCSGYDGYICDNGVTCIYCGDIYEYDCDACECNISAAALAGFIIGGIVGLALFIWSIWCCCKAQCCKCCCCNEHNPNK